MISGNPKAFSLPLFSQKKKKATTKQTKKKPTTYKTKQTNKVVEELRMSVENSLK